MMKPWMTHAVVAVAAASVAGGLAWWGRGNDVAVAKSSIERDKEKKQAAKVMYNCPMHPWIIKEEPGHCPICGMSLVPMKDHGQGAPVEASQGAIHIDPSVIQNMGVKTEVVRVRDLSKVVRLSGKLAGDETRQVSVNAKIMGWVEKLNADYLGKPIKAGEVLMELYSPDLLATQEEFLQALRYSRGLPASATTETRRSAEDLVTSARRRLEYWDIPASAIDRLIRDGKVRKTLPMVSPASGVVIAKNVVEGQNIMAGTELLRIADLSRIWALGEIYQEDLPYVKVGQKARVLISYLPGKFFDGKVAFIAPVLDPQSKTTVVRVELRNTPDLLLKPEMVADVELSFPVGEKLAVPDQAIIRTGRRNVAIIALGEGYFEPRDVELGASAGEYVQILSGLKEGEVLVTSSQFLIDSESNLKSAVMGMGGGNSGATAPAGKAPLPVEPGHAVSTDPATHTQVDTLKAFRLGLGKVFETYLPLQAALASDDTAKARKAVTGLKAALSQVEGKDLKDAVLWSDSRKILLTSLVSMEKATDITGLRGPFQEASHALIALLRHYGYEASGKARVFHCTMAKDGRGADWIQSDKETRNPYYGADMATCGDDQGTL